MKYYGNTNRIYNLASTSFAQGGEGKIFDVIGNNDIVAKLYKDTSDSSLKEKKLLAMVKKPLPQNLLTHVAWPLDTLYDSNHKFVGFIMPRLEKCEELNVIYEYGSEKYGRISWDNKITIAKNLCAILDGIHEKGYVVGDLNPKNISVNPPTGKQGIGQQTAGHVFFFDVDSFQVTENGNVLRCLVGMPEYLAPEIQRKLKTEKDYAGRPKKIGELSLPTFTKETDNFALALHIFQLLMNGTHPFACRVLPSQSSIVQPQPSDNILKGIFPFMQHQSGIDIPIYAPKITIFPKEIQDLFRKAFIDGYSNPSARPTAAAWHAALSKLTLELTNCMKVAYHKYFNQLRQCPWCEVDNNYQLATGKIRTPHQTTRPTVMPPTTSGIVSSVTKKTTGSKIKRHTVHPAAKTFAILLPILAFILGQALQYLMYLPDRQVWIISSIFGEVPLIFMVISTISCALCTAMICFNAWNLIDNNNLASGWILNILSDVAIAAIPCFTSWIGIIVYPIVTVALSDKRYNLEEDTTKCFSICLPILLFIIGQIVQYYLYVTGTDGSLLASFLTHVPLWLQIVSTVCGVVATILTCYSGWQKADSGDIGHACAIIFIASLCLGVLPSVFAVPALVVLSFITYQINENCEEYIPVAPTVFSFITGQVVLYWSYATTGNVAIITSLNAMTDTTINMLAFLIVTSVLGMAAMIMTACLGRCLADRYNRIHNIGTTYFLLIPFNFLMIALPTVSSIPLFVVSIVFLCARKIKRLRVLIIVLLSIVLGAVCVMGCLDTATANKEYKISLDSNGGTGGASSISVAYDDPMPSADPPARTGYTFNGYFSESTGGTQYYDSNMNSVNSWDKKKNATLYAQWTANNYTVTFDKQGGTGGSNSVTATYDNVMPDASAPSKNGYSFNGYFISMDENAIQYYNANMQSVKNWDIAKSTMLYAHWTAQSFLITFDKQGGTGGSDTVTATFGNAMPNASAPSRIGYKFDGYYTSTSGYGTRYYNGSMESTRSWDISKPTTLYASWISTLALSLSQGSISNLSDSVTITLSASGGSGNYVYRLNNSPSGVNCSLSGNRLTVSKTSNNASGTISVSVSDLDYGTTATRSISYTTSGCFAAGTLVMMADGTQKKIEDVRAGDLVLSWNFITGKLEPMPVSLYWDHGEDSYEVMNLYFSSGDTVRVINTHGFFDYTLNKFVYITNENYAEFINHDFIYIDSNSTLSRVSLSNVTFTIETTGSYSLRSSCNDNVIVAGLISLTWEDYVGMLTYFDMGNGMKYDFEKMQADIDTYGLYSYEEWSDYVTYEEFVALNGQYFKILVGKGILREEDILGLIEGMRQ